MTQPKLNFTRYFSKAAESNQDFWEVNGIHFEERDSYIKEPNGSVVFAFEGIEVPTDWSQLATDILASKYARMAGVPGTGKEVSAKQIVDRIAFTIAEQGWEWGYFSRDSMEAFRDDLRILLMTQRAAFNSPVWFNCGLYHQYGIEGNGESWYWDYHTMQVEKTRQSYKHPRCSACFILGMEDSLEGIFDTIKVEASIFKYGAGSGLDVGKLRSKYEVLSGGGVSSGAMSFLEIYDKAAGAIKSGGTTRRAATMRVMNVSHPEVLDFIRWKAREEDKAKDLISTGKWGADFNSEAYRTVSGQNSNNSVRLSDEFMEAYWRDDEWNTRFVTTGEVHETYRARDIMREIAEAAWSCADPGVQFDGAIQNWHTCPNAGRINATNPCSEFVFLDDTACNLSSLNLTKFWDGEEFNVPDYKATAQRMITAMDIAVDLSSYPTESIAKNSHDYRPLGIGFCNLGALLMRMGIPYDSDKGRAWAAALTSIITGTAYSQSVMMASVKGPFPQYYDGNESSMLHVLNMHRMSAHMIEGAQRLPQEVRDEAVACWNSGIKIAESKSPDGFTNGVRNSQISVMAPTGTIGLLMDCDTTGVEPDYSLVKYKVLAGGGMVKIVNHSVRVALEQLGYSPQDCEIIVDYIHENDTIIGAPHLKEDDLPVFSCANGDQALSPMAHLSMIAAVQPFISGSISKTINLPNNATVEDIERLYLDAWDMGIKCMSVYRDGSKGSQPLNAKSSVTENQAKEAVAQPQKRDLPKRRRGETLEVKIAGHKLFLRTGEYPDGTLGEIFIDTFKDGAAYASILNSFAIAVSTSLQYGVPLEKYVDKFSFTKFEPAGMTDDENIRSCHSILDFIFRWLAMRYLGRYDLVHVAPEEPVDISAHNVHDDIGSVITERERDAHQYHEMGDAPPCDMCGNLTVRNGTCYRCLSCGNSMGCS